MSGLTFKVTDVAKVRDAAKAKGCPVSGDSFHALRRDVRARCVSCLPSPAAAPGPMTTAGQLRHGNWPHGLIDRPRRPGHGLRRETEAITAP